MDWQLVARYFTDKSTDIFAVYGEFPIILILSPPSSSQPQATLHCMTFKESGLLGVCYKSGVVLSVLVSLQIRWGIGG